MRPPSGGAGSHTRGRCLVPSGRRSDGVILARIADPGSATQGGGGLRWGILSRPDRPSRRTRLKLQEFHARQLLRASGLPVPAWSVATTPQEVGEAAVRYLAGGAERVVVKAQVLVGGRGKAGGGKLAANPEEGAAVGRGLLGMGIKGITGGRGLGGRRRRDRGGRPDRSRGRRSRPRTPPPGAARVPGAPDGLRPRPGRPPG